MKERKEAISEQSLGNNTMLDALGAHPQQQADYNSGLTAMLDQLQRQQSQLSPYI